MSISEAALALKVSPARVRAMAAHGQLPAIKIANRWLVERSAVERRLRSGAQRGRPFAPVNAWALLALASGGSVEQVDASVRSRIRRVLASEGLQKASTRLRRRAEVFSFSAHPGEIPYLLEDRELVRSGVSAVGGHGFGLISGREADGYLQEDHLNDFVARHALQPAGAEGNVRLRLVPGEAWGFLKNEQFAPRAAVALDLSDELDPRSAQAGRKALRELDRYWRSGKAVVASAIH